MNFLDGLVHEQAEEDDCRAGWREIVLAEELILSRAGLVQLEVAREAEGALGGHAVLEGEALSGEQVLLDVGPLGQSLPDGGEMVFG